MWTCSPQELELLCRPWQTCKRQRSFGYVSFPLLLSFWRPFLLELHFFSGILPASLHHKMVFALLRTLPPLFLFSTGDLSLVRVSAISPASGSAVCRPDRPEPILLCPRVAWLGYVNVKYHVRPLRGGGIVRQFGREVNPVECERIPGRHPRVRVRKRVAANNAADGRQVINSVR